MTNKPINQTRFNQFSSVAQLCLTQSLRCVCDPGFSRPEYWSGKPFPSPGDLPNPGIKPRSPAPQVDSLPAEPPGNPWWALGNKDIK